MVTKTDETKIGLVTKLAIIMGELGNVPKEGFNKAQNYKFVRETDVVAKLVPLLAAHHIFLHQTVTSHDRVPLYQTQSGMTMWITTVTVEGTWYDGDTGETLPAATFVGTGADTGDKGAFKAMTGAEKYMLMKTFLISTGDDPEADEKVDKTAAAAAAATGPLIKRGNVEGAERGGKSTNVTEAQVREMSRLTKAAGLTVKTVIPVIASVLGRAPENGQSVHDFLLTLSSEDGGKVVSVLSDFKVAEDVIPDPPEEASQTTEQEDFSLV